MTHSFKKYEFLKKLKKDTHRVTCFQSRLELCVCRTPLRPLGVTVVLWSNFYRGQNPFVREQLLPRGQAEFPVFL